MKKRLVYILATLVIVLMGCSEDKQEAQENEIKEWGAIETIDEDRVAIDEAEEEVFGDILDEPLYELDASWGFQAIGDADSKVVLLTVDDAPDKHALGMARQLKEMDAPAIFFVNGHFINSDEEKEVLKEIYELGFAIGNHTKTHANLQQIPEEEQREEIVGVSDIIEEVIGERPKFFRAPFGMNSDYSKALVEEEGMLLMNWSFGYDWEKEYMNGAALADIMVNTELLRDGSNLLMHDREWTADALKDIVGGLREKGYGFIDPATIKGVVD